MSLLKHLQRLEPDAGWQERGNPPSRSFHSGHVVLVHRKSRMAVGLLHVVSVSTLRSPRDWLTVDGTHKDLLTALTMALAGFRAGEAISSATKIAADKAMDTP